MTVAVIAVWTMRSMVLPFHHPSIPRDADACTAGASQRAVHYAGLSRGLVEVQRHVLLDAGGPGLVAGGVSFDVFVKGTAMTCSQPPAQETRRVNGRKASGVTHGQP